MCVSGDSSVLLDLHGSCECIAESSILHAVGCGGFVHRFSISRSFVRYFPERSWMIVAFHCFTEAMSFSWYSLYCYSSSEFLQSHNTALLSIISRIHAPLDVVVHVFVFLRSFRFRSFLSQFSPFVARSRISAVTRLLSSDDVCQGSHCLFESLLC